MVAPKIIPEHSVHTGVLSESPKSSDAYEKLLKLHHEQLMERLRGCDDSEKKHQVYGMLMRDYIQSLESLESTKRVVGGLIVDNSHGKSRRNSRFLQLSETEPQSPLKQVSEHDADANLDLGTSKRPSSSAIMENSDTLLHRRMQIVKMRKGTIFDTPEKQVRVLEANFVPITIDSMDTLGAYIFGRQRYGIFRFWFNIKGNGIIGWLSTVYYFLGASFTILQMAHLLDHTIGFDLFCSLGLGQSILFLIFDLNRTMCFMLLKRFDVWFNILNSFALSLSMLLLIFSGDHMEAQFAWGVGFLLSNVIVWFTDALPSRKRILICKYFFPMYSFGLFIIQFGIWNDWYDLHPFSWELGGLNWTASGQASSSLTFLNLYMIRYLVSARRNPDHLIILNAPMTSNKQQASTVNIKQHAMSLRKSSYTASEN